MSHSDNVTALPEGFSIANGIRIKHLSQQSQTMKKDFTAYSSMLKQHLVSMGIQSSKIFVKNIAKAAGDWSMAGFVDQQIKEIREKVGDKKVLLGLSGGVDSSVVGVLLQRAIGDQLTSIFVDHGLLRKGEAEQVMNDLGGKFGLNIIKVDCKDRFMGKLSGIADPEKNVKSVLVMNLSKYLMMKHLN